MRLTCDSPSGSANSSKLAWPAGQRPNSAVNRSAMKSRSDVYKPCAHGNQSGIQVWGGGFCWFNPGTSLQFRGCFWRVGRIVIDDPLPIAARLCQPVDRLPRPTGNCSARLSLRGVEQERRHHSVSDVLAGRQAVVARHGDVKGRACRWSVADMDPRLHRPGYREINGVVVVDSGGLTRHRNGPIHATHRGLVCVMGNRHNGR